MGYWAEGLQKRQVAWRNGMLRPLLAIISLAPLPQGKEEDFVIAIAIAIVAGFPYSSQDDFSREARISSGFAQYLSEN